VVLFFLLMVAGICALIGYIPWYCNLLSMIDRFKRSRRIRNSIWSAGAGVVMATTLLVDAVRAQMVFPQKGDLNIVAHQDDDILFMNPDILGAALKGTSQVVVFLTGGDFRKNDLWYGQMRENGAMHGYSKLLQLAGRINRGDFKSAKLDPNTCAPFTDKITENPGTIEWNRTQIMVGSHRIEVATTHNARPLVVLVFLRLYASTTEYGTPVRINLQNEEVGESANLSRLFRGMGPATIQSFDGRNEYTRAQLISTLQNIIQLVKPNIVRTQDSENIYNVDGDDAHRINDYYYDHSDHYWGARFAKEAIRRERVGSYLIYKGYNVALIDSPSNRLESSDRCYKKTIMYFYGLNDPKVMANDANGLTGRFVDFNYNFIGHQEQLRVQLR
jgi:GlcNAc-PI de-N-acetylase